MTTMTMDPGDSDLSTNEEGCSDKQCCHNTPAAVVARRETLTSRAKRIIGRPIDSPEKKKTKNQPRQPTEASSKRREQVLQAQRTHRQRTQGYIKELEKEVLTLRDHEVNCKTAEDKNKILVDRIEKLENILRRNSIPFELEMHEPLSLDLSQTMPHTPMGIPSPYGDTDGILSPMTSMSQNMTDMALMTPPASTSSLSGSGDATQSLFVNLDFSDFVPIQPDQFPDFLNADDSTPIFSVPDSLNSCHQHVSTADDPELVSQQAIDFVITLERICFDHLDLSYYSRLMNASVPSNALPPVNPPSTPTSNAMNMYIDGSTGHAYSAIVNLIHHANMMKQTGTRYEFPKNDVEKLFRATLHVDRLPGITPYQIWANLVRIRYEGHDVCPERVALILKQCEKYVRCTGFGAVVDKPIIDQLLACFYPGQSYQISWT